MKTRLQILTALTVVVMTASCVVILLGPDKPPPPAPPPTPPPPLTTEQVSRIVAEAMEDWESRQQPPEPPPTAPPEPKIERQAVDGQDLADLLNLAMWRFDYHLPQVPYTAYLWAEARIMSATTSDLVLLATTSGTWSQGRVVLKLPGREDPRLFIRLGPENIVRADQLTGMVTPPAPFRWTLLDSQPLPLDKPVTLVTMVQEPAPRERPANENAAAPTEPIQVELKIGFASGMYVPFDYKKWSPNAIAPAQSQ